MPSTPPTGSPDPRRPDAGARDDEPRRTSWRLRRRERRDREAAEERIKHQGTWVDVQIQPVGSHFDLAHALVAGNIERMTVH